MSNKLTKQPKTNLNQYSSVVKKLFLLGAVSGCVTAIVVGIMGLLSILKPASNMDVALLAAGSIGIYIYATLELKDKVKAWGLTK